MKNFDFSIFKAYDIRGVYPEQINKEFVYNIGRAYLDYIRELEKVDEPQIVVGRDARESSDEFFEAFSRGITDQGGDVFDIDLVTTPMLYWAVNFLTAQGGAMITASHNPGEYNGLKLTRSKAVVLGGETGLDKIKDKIIKDNFKEGETKELIAKKEVIPYYIDFLVKDFKDLGFDGKLVIDTGNGMAGYILPKLLDRMGINYVPLFFDIDCNFPNHEANPLKEETLDKLKETIKKEKADLGVAFDGDGDRVVFVTEKGEVIRGDFITAILSEQYLTEYNGASIVYDIRCSKVVNEKIEKFGGKSFVSKVGHPNMKSKMMESGAIFGGELSSHIYFAFDFPMNKSYFESGLYTMLKFIKLLVDKSKKASEILKPLNKYAYSGEINFEVKNKKKVMEKIEKEYKKRGEINKIDGIRIDINTKNGWFWFIVRPSNTEPVLRMIMEAKNKKILEEKLLELQNIIIKEGGKIK